MINKKVKKRDFSRSYREAIARTESLSVKVAPIEDLGEADKEIETYASAIAVAKALIAACV
ncbi:hypothetical protein [Treponema vincentii]|uniref:hypothetical protein n=1 Tax=Treponema vincentii TaxID=69710 RepID=UPI0020A3EAA9|nr:hypothetical protein [Treponema vincentii]UTC49280.1 hypothetical protein E4N73_10775 [Treponema vincentii]